MDDEELHDDDLHDGEDRETQVRNALLKALGVVVGIGIAVAVGTVIVVKALGLSEADAPGPIGAPPSALPTTALPAPGEESASADPSADPTDQPSDLVTPKVKDGRIDLVVSPREARPMERVDMTGTYEGGNGVQLQVQRYEDGVWSDFGVSATVRSGGYKTYVMTGRAGENRFRMYDPASERGSNVVLVTIG